MVGNNCYPWFSRGDRGSMLVLFNRELGHIPLQTNLLRTKLRCSAGIIFCVGWLGFRHVNWSGLDSEWLTERI